MSNRAQKKRIIVKDNLEAIENSSLAKVKDLRRSETYKKFFSDCPNLLDECNTYCKDVINTHTGLYSNAPSHRRKGFLNRECPNLMTNKFSTLKTAITSIVVSVANEYLPKELEIKGRGI